MRKKIIYFLSLFISFILLGLSLFSNFTYSPFNSSYVKENIRLLSSDTYDGRLPGSKGNILATEIINKTFKDNGLLPLNDTYKESFNVTAPVFNNTDPYLKIFYDNGYEESLKYGVDFKEDMINFRKTNFTFSFYDKINVFSNYIEIQNGTGRFIFYVSPKNDFSFRSSFSSNYPYDMMVIITSNAYDKIINSLKSNATISINIPFSTEEKEIFNIVGVIKGTSSDLAPLVLTAHFDHLGEDSFKNTYYGALDNASGTSFLLELQRSLCTYGRPKRDIIFVALNAEEFGLLGSQNFAKNNLDKIKNSQVINFDMIGSEGYPLTLMVGASYKNKDSNLLKSIEKIAKSKNVETKVVYENSSDHASFNDLGVDALSFCHSDLSKIHTPNDTYEYISLDAIDSAYSVAQDKIFKSSYSFTTNFFYGKTSIFIFSILFGFILSAPIINRLKKCRIY